MSHRRTEPDGQIVQLLGGDARQASENLRDVVLSVPSRQTPKECLHRIMFRHLFWGNILCYLRFGATLFQHLFALGTNDDAVQGSWRQRSIIQICLKRGARETVALLDSIAVSLFISLRQNRKLNLPVKDVSTETVVCHQELLNDKHSFLRGS